jgi:hypothetical protein
MLRTVTKPNHKQEQETVGARRFAASGVLVVVVGLDEQGGVSGALVEAAVQRDGSGLPVRSRSRNHFALLLGTLVLHHRWKNIQLARKGRITYIGAALDEKLIASAAEGWSNKGK